MLRSPGKFIIGARGLRPLSTQMLPLAPNTLVPLGASSSPDHVFLTRVTDHWVEYRHYPYFGTAPLSMERDVFNDLCRTALETEVARWDQFMNSDWGRKCGTADPTLWLNRKRSNAAYRELLAGRDAMPREKLEDYERVEVWVHPKPDADWSSTRGKDPWNWAEQFGGVTGMDGPPKALGIDTTRQHVAAILAEPRVIVQSVRTLSPHVGPGVTAVAA